MHDFFNNIIPMKSSYRPAVSRSYILPALS
jgi:hypothetical protein